MVERAAKPEETETPAPQAPSAPVPEVYTPEAAYAVDEPTRGETCDALGERFEFSFHAGTVRPKSERDEIALEQLYRLGRATRDGERLARPGETEEAEA